MKHMTPTEVINFFSTVALPVIAIILMASGKSDKNVWIAGQISRTKRDVLEYTVTSEVTSTPEFEQLLPFFKTVREGVYALPHADARYFLFLNSQQFRKLMQAFALVERAYDDTYFELLREYEHLSLDLLQRMRHNQMLVRSKEMELQHALIQRQTQDLLLLQEQSSRLVSSQTYKPPPVSVPSKVVPPKVSSRGGVVSNLQPPGGSNQNAWDLSDDEEQVEPCDDYGFATGDKVVITLAKGSKTVKRTGIAISSSVIDCGDVAGKLIFPPPPDVEIRDIQVVAGGVVSNLTACESQNFFNRSTEFDIDDFDTWNSVSPSIFEAALYARYPPGQNFSQSSANKELVEWFKSSKGQDFMNLSIDSRNFGQRLLWRVRTMHVTQDRSQRRKLFARFEKLTRPRDDFLKAVDDLKISGTQTSSEWSGKKGNKKFCSHCKKSGHWRSDCFQLHPEKKNQSRSDQKNGRREESRQ